MRMTLRQLRAFSDAASARLKKMYANPGGKSRGAMS